MKGNQYANNFDMELSIVNSNDKNILISNIHPMLSFENLKIKLQIELHTF